MMAFSARWAAHRSHPALDRARAAVHVMHVDVRLRLERPRSPPRHRRSEHRRAEHRVGALQRTLCFLIVEAHLLDFLVSVLRPSRILRPYAAAAVGQAHAG